LVSVSAIWTIPCGTTTTRADGEDRGGVEGKMTVLVAPQRGAADRGLRRVLATWQMNDDASVRRAGSPTKSSSRIGAASLSAARRRRPSLKFTAVAVK
jgi:hypothetical protein